LTIKNFQNQEICKVLVLLPIKLPKMGTNRRTFVKQSIAMAAAPSIIDSASKPDQKKINSFIHHVFFYLNDTSPAGVAKLVEGLKALSKVKTIGTYHVGIPADTNRDVIVNDYTVSWCLFFRTPEAQQKYQVDPIHLKFVEDYKHLWNKVVVYDSETYKF
jgi:hypothetical protein